MFQASEFSLRPVQSSDLPVLFQWHNADHVRAAAFSDNIIAPDQSRRWFDALVNDRRCRHAIFERSQVPLGLLTFHTIDPRHNTAHWGFFLGSPDCSKGTGTVLTFLGLDYGFSELRLRKITAEVLASNAKSIKLHQKLGFANEGLFREQIQKNGTFHDVLVFALFARDWRDKFRRSVGCDIFGEPCPNAEIVSPGVREQAQA